MWDGEWAKIRGVLFGTVASVVLVGCDEPPDESAGDGGEVDADAPEVRSWPELEPTRLDEVPASKERALEWTPSSRYDPCREYFESNGEVEESFPELEPSVAEVRAGCNPEAWVETESRRYVAYRVPVEESERRDLRFVAYEGGELAWSETIARDQYGADFTANFLGSFIVPLHPHVACAGTRWQGGTRVACLRRDGGEVVYSGRLSFWTGIPLQGNDTSLVGAEVSGLTRRYPYSGVEMARRDFETTGGRLSLYVTDGKRLLFASDEEPARLSGYDFDGFEPLWRLELPGLPETDLEGGGLPGLPIAVVEIEGALYAVDPGAGDVLWGLGLGGGSVRVEHDGENLYVMRHRAEEPNELFAVDPEQGEVAWRGEVPLGSLDVEVIDGEVFAESVRAVRRLVDVSADSGDPE